MTDLKVYTVSQVRDWLMHNQAPDGLTDEVIRPSLAWAIIHHPDVLDEDPIIASIYDNGILAASTCAFPEVLEAPSFPDETGKQRRIWWFPMLWVKPDYRGKAYGLVAIGSLAEIYGVDCAWTAWAVPEAIEIFEYLGCKTYYMHRYFMGDKVIHLSSIRGKVASIKQSITKWWLNFRKLALPRYDYELRYLTHVDDATYRFICQHRKDSFIQSSCRVLNWRLHYPWDCSCSLSERVPRSGDYFADVHALIQHSFVQVWHKNSLVGVYKLDRSDHVSCDDLYYDEEASTIVFASVVEHLKRLGVTHFDTDNAQLKDFVQQYIYFPKVTTENISISVPPEVEVPAYIIQK